MGCIWQIRKRIKSLNITKRVKQRLLIFIVAYNAELTIEWVLSRIPKKIVSEFDLEVLVIDDQSTDKTFEKAEIFRQGNNKKFKLTILYNVLNQGYGGNQKIGYHYAIKNKFDFVALVHGDGQYPPEEISNLAQPLASGEVDAVFGSRMMVRGAALAGGMPLYKFLGNKILTYCQNKLLNAKLSEYHSGFRIYSVSALNDLPFSLNSDDFHFDTEIIIQLLLSGRKIKEMPIPTYYGNEICHVNGMMYAIKVLQATLRANLQKYTILYDPKFDCENDSQTYTPKFNYPSPHSLAVKSIHENDYVLDLGCAGGYVADRLFTKKGCKVIGLDMIKPVQGNKLDAFILCDLDKELPKKTPDDVDCVLMLDVIEHLSNIEGFLDRLKEHFKHNEKVTMFVSTGNIAFFITRLLHLFGMFNYGKKGILDLTHKRLFTRKTFINLFEQRGFVVQNVTPVPGPWQMIFGNGAIGKLFTFFNVMLCRVWPQMFAYQFFLQVKPKPHLDALLLSAKKRKLNS